jgi:hypothetical protein
MTNDDTAADDDGTAAWSAYAKEWEALAQEWIAYAEHLAAENAELRAYTQRADAHNEVLRQQIQGHVFEKGKLKNQIATLTANNKRQADSIHAYQHRLDHLTYHDLTDDAKREVMREAIRRLKSR